MLAGEANLERSGRRPLAIVPQFGETMIRMSRTTRCVAQLLFGLIVVFWWSVAAGAVPPISATSPPRILQVSTGGRTVRCSAGRRSARANTVCCYKKAPPLAICISPLDYQKLGCEKMDLPCFTSSDCPGGLNCCLMFSRWQRQRHGHLPATVDVPGRRRADVHRLRDQPGLSPDQAELHVPDVDAEGRLQHLRMTRMAARRSRRAIVRRGLRARRAATRARLPCAIV